MHLRHVLIALAAALAAPAAAGAAARATGMHDARYCEILELRGQHVDVWNTIGHNRCPAAAWDEIDAVALAQERGDTAVIKNGPRHFLMDAATASVGSEETFNGLTMTRVARIPIRSDADLVRATYADRTINRTNTWEWNAGRRIFELVAPGGDVYVMQSYALMVDPALTLAKLPGLDLDLPEGWRYRSRVVSKRYVLRAKGAATILQDELQNTYQLVRTTRPAGPRKKRTVAVDGKTKNVPQDDGSIRDVGTLTSTPFGKGTIVLTGKLADGKLDGTFRLRFAKGSIRGSVLAPFTVHDGTIEFDGTARFLGGTGAYRGITSGELRVHDTNTLDGQNGVVSLDGAATW
jgi:hypothetical protein